MEIGVTSRSAIVMDKSFMVMIFNAVHPRPRPLQHSHPAATIMGDIIPRTQRSVEDVQGNGVILRGVISLDMLLQVIISNVVQDHPQQPLPIYHHQ